MDSALRTHVRKILRALDAADAAEAAAVKKVEDDGHRIVDGGSLGDDEWNIADWRTGEVLASGSDGYDEYCAVLDRLDPEGRWVHIDRIHDDKPWTDYDITPTDGIPPSLSDALVDWAENRGTPAEEIAQVAGWPEEEAAECRQAPAVKGNDDA